MLSRVRTANDQWCGVVSDENCLLIIPTPIGSIAIPIETVLTARTRANTLLPSPVESRKRDFDSAPLVSAEAIAKLFDVDSTWFLTRARENRIPHIRIGKYIRFDPDEVRKFLDEKSKRHANS